MTADQTMALWRVQTYGQMSQGLGDPCCVTSASLASCFPWKTHLSIILLPSHAAVCLGKNLFPLFARSLDLSPDFFDDKVCTDLLAYQW